MLNCNVLGANIFCCCLFGSFFCVSCNNLELLSDAGPCAGDKLLPSGVPKSSPSSNASISVVSYSSFYSAFIPCYFTGFEAVFIFILFSGESTKREQIKCKKTNVIKQ